MQSGKIGGLLGSLAVASLGDFRHQHLLLLGSGVVSALALLLFARTSNFYAALACLFLIGMVNNAYMVTRSALLQTSSSPEMRGRMVGFWRIVWGLSPLGLLPAGALVDHWGAPMTVTGLAFVSLGVFCTLLFVVQRSHRLE